MTEITLPPDVVPIPVKAIGDIPDITPDDDASIFRIVGRGPLRLVDGDNAGVRACTHPRYVLDDEWMTVTCDVCKERLEPYAVLRANAGYCAKIRRERMLTEQAEWRFLAASCRDMLKRSCFKNDPERDHLRGSTYFYGKDSLAAMRALHKQLEQRVRAARDERREKRLADRRRPRAVP